MDAPTFRVAVIGSGYAADAFAHALRALPVRTTLVDPADAAFVRADVVVLATGSFALPDEGLIAAAARNVPSVAWVVRRLDEAVPDAVLVIASPPVALTTRIAIDVSTREGARIIGVSSEVPTQAASVAAVVASILADDDAIHDVCAGAPRAYGVGDVVLALPCRIGRRGIQERLVVARDPEAQLGFAVTAATLRAAYDTLVGGAAVG